VTGIILAGGKSLRMGEQKLFLRMGGVPLFERVYRVLKPIFDDILVVANNPEWFRSYRVRVVRDILPGRGALGGIYTGLRCASGDAGFCFAADMPFLNAGLIRHIMERGDEGDVIIPRTPDGLQPLHAIYSRRCLLPMEKLLAEGDLKIVDFFGDVTVVYVSEGEIRRYDPLLLSFLNVNTRQDLLEAQELITRTQEMDRL